jgi:hypothetical protein
LIVEVLQPILIAYAKQDKIKAIFFIPWFFLLNFLCLQCIGYIEVDAGIFSYRFLFLKPMADNELTKMLACSSTCTFETLTLTVDQQSSSPAGMSDQFVAVRPCFWRFLPSQNMPGSAACRIGSLDLYVYFFESFMFT